jgi:hypothetical protein
MSCGLQPQCQVPPRSEAEAALRPICTIEARKLRQPLALRERGSPLARLVFLMRVCTARRQNRGGVAGRNEVVTKLSSGEARRTEAMLALTLTDFGIVRYEAAFC